MPVVKQIIETTLFNIVPLAPYPETEQCLGLRPADSEMAIKDGYAVLAFDYEVIGARDSCLFEMGSLLEKRRKFERGSGRLDVLADNDVAKDFLAKTAEGLAGLKKIAPEWKAPDLELYGIKMNQENLADSLKNPAKMIENVMSIASNPQLAKDLEAGKKMVDMVATMDFKNVAKNLAKYGLGGPKESSDPFAKYMQK